MAIGILQGPQRHVHTMGTRGILLPWTLAVFLGETLGFTAPAAVGALLYATSAPSAVQLVLLVAAGAIEGLVLGGSQSIVLRRYLAGFRPTYWIRNTMLAASFAWSIGMMPSTLGTAFLDYWYVTLPLAVVLAPALLLSIGFAQYLELRRLVPHANWWIWANAGAWLVGTSWVFVAMAFVSEGDPTWAIALAGLIGGALMALTVAASTGLCLAVLLRHAEQRSRDPLHS